MVCPTGTSHGSGDGGGGVDVDVGLCESVGYSS